MPTNPPPDCEGCARWRQRWLNLLAWLHDEPNPTDTADVILAMNRLTPLRAEREHWKEVATTDRQKWSFDVKKRKGKK